MSEQPLFSDLLCLEGIEYKGNENRRMPEREIQMEQSVFVLSITHIWVNEGFFVHCGSSSSFIQLRRQHENINCHALFVHYCPPLFLALYPQCFVTSFTRSPSLFLSKCVWPAASQQLPICQGSVQMVMCWPHILSGEVVEMGAVVAVVGSSVQSHFNPHTSVSRPGVYEVGRGGG